MSTSMLPTINMYRVEPVYQANAVCDLPKSMYRLPNLHPSSGTRPVKQLDDRNASECVKKLLDRQLHIISRIEELAQQVDSLAKKRESSSKSHDLPKDLVISCNPSCLPQAVLALVSRLCKKYNTTCSVYVHSSTLRAPVVDLTMAGFLQCTAGVSRGSNRMLITWIWTQCDDCELMVSPLRQTKISGEANIVRYLARLLGEWNSSPVISTQLDAWLDYASFIIHGTNSERGDAVAQVVKQLQKNPWLVGSAISVADLVVWSALERTAATGKWLTNVIKTWQTNCQKTSDL